MLGRRAAAAANDACPLPHVAGRVICEHLRARLVHDLRPDDLRDPCVRLHPDGDIAGRSEHLGDDEIGILERPAAVRPDGGDAERGDRRDGVARADAHHRASAHVEAERGDHGQVGGARDALERPHALLDREERLQHEQVDAALGERGSLLGERLDARVVCEQPVGLDQLSRRPERPRHELAAGTLARELGSAQVDLARTSRQRPLGKTERRGAEGAREDDVASRLDERPVQLDHLVGSVEQPLLRSEARLDPHRLVVRARRAVRYEHAALGE